VKRVLLSAAAAFAVITPVWAQVPSSGSSQPPSPAAVSDPYGWQAMAPTPRDAYREGLINRWEFEQIEGPLPQAMQGPSPDGSKGQDGGGSGFGQ
jgi:hypothetical protein